jgi:CelD/BcsL family acetyltransferase involved in cellulose biosynthesis
VNLAVEWVDSLEGFAALADEWDAILPEDSRPFALHEWHMAWLEAFSGGREPAVCTARREDGALAGVLPMLRAGRRFEAGNVHSCVFRPVAREPQAVEALTAAVLEDASTLTVNELVDGDPRAERLAGSIERAGMALLREPGTVSPIVDTRGKLDAWVERANTSWIKRVRRYRRKTNKDHEAGFELFASPADLEPELDACFALEASGWKGRAGTAIASRPETDAFYRKVAVAFDARGELRINRIVLDGELAAFNICIEYGGRLYALKTAYNERFRKIAPGLVLQVSLIEACFERGLDAYEILGEETEWKRNLATSRRTNSTLRAYRRTPLGRARYAYRAALRPRLKRVRSRFGDSER